MKLVWITCGILLGFASPGSCDNLPKIDNSGKGAVLCSHAIISGIYEFTLLCRPSETNKISELKSALALYEAFIARNGHISLDAAVQRTTRARQSVLVPSASLSTATCAAVKSGGRDFLAHYADGLSIEALRESTRETLSVDREPAMNPCL